MVNIIIFSSQQCRKELSMTSWKIEPCCLSLKLVFSMCLHFYYVQKVQISATINFIIYSSVTKLVLVAVINVFRGCLMVYVIQHSLLLLIRFLWRDKVRECLNQYSDILHLHDPFFIYISRLSRVLFSFIMFSVHDVVTDLLQIYIMSLK